MKEKDIKLIEDNIALIYWCCYKLNMQDEDMIQDIFLKCCNAISKYEEKKGNISTFLYTVALHEKILQEQYKHRTKRIPENLKISIYDKICSGINSGTETDLKWEDIISDDSTSHLFYLLEYNEEIDIYTQKYKKYFPKNCDRDLDIFVHYINGDTDEELRGQFNLSHQGINNIINKIKLFFKKCREDNFDLYHYNENLYNKYYPLIKTKTLKLDNGRLIREEFSSKI